MTRQPRIAVLLPCYNEGPVIAGVVHAFRLALPECDVYVYDNASTDGTAEQARSAGAIVRREMQQGKGHVVRRMFADIEADIYVLADGDGTYDASMAPRMIQLLLDDNLDMVVGARVHGDNARAYRFGHVFGNQFLTATVGKLFESRFRDILSGYRVMSRRLVKSFPALASGYEIEAMLTIHTLDLRLPHAEVDCAYSERGKNTASKLKTVRDGFRILGTIALLFKEFHPLRFFGMLALLLVAAALAFGVPIVIEFAETRLVPRFPTAILASALMVLSGISLTCGLILDSVARSRREIKRLHYQSLLSVREALGVAKEYGESRPSGAKERAQRRG